VVTAVPSLTPVPVITWPTCTGTAPWAVTVRTCPEIEPVNTDGAGGAPFSVESASSVPSLTNGDGMLTPLAMWMPVELALRALVTIWPVLWTWKPLLRVVVPVWSAEPSNTPVALTGAGRFGDVFGS